LFWEKYGHRRRSLRLPRFAALQLRRTVRTFRTTVKARALHVTWTLKAMRIETVNLSRSAGCELKVPRHTRTLFDID